MTLIAARAGAARRRPVRTGVTVVVPHDGYEPLFAGCHRLNGNGELTGLEWIRDSGCLTTPIGLTNTHSVGVVRDALVAADVAGRDDDEMFWSLPVVGETWDGVLNDINGFHVRAEHVHEALARAPRRAGRGGRRRSGTGMICHGFKGGLGTASRVVPEASGAWTVGVLVQANHGRRDRLAVDGLPVGRLIGPDVVPLPWDEPEGAGSIIVLCATDAPLLPHQCTRLAQRCALGIGRTGGAGEHSSGDLVLAFSTVRQGVPASEEAAPGDPVTIPLTMVVDAHMDPLFYAAVEATEAAIVNALLAARDDDRPRRDHRARAHGRAAGRRDGPARARLAPTRAVDRRLHRRGRRFDDRPVAGSEARRLQREQPPRALERRSAGATSPAPGSGNRGLSRAVVSTPPSVENASPHSSVRSRVSRNATCPGVCPGAAITSSEPIAVARLHRERRRASARPASCRAASPAARPGRATCPCRAAAPRAPR